MTKAEEISNPSSTWNKIADDEPVFILRARDCLAPKTIVWWCARLREIAGFGSQNKIDEAMSLRAAMHAYADRFGKKIPD